MSVSDPYPSFVGSQDGHVEDEDDGLETWERERQEAWEADEAQVLADAQAEEEADLERDLIARRRALTKEAIAEDLGDALSDAEKEEIWRDVVAKREAREEGADDAHARGLGQVSGAGSSYVCVQCGPDPRGGEAHAYAEHTIDGLFTSGGPVHVEVDGPTTPPPGASDPQGGVENGPDGPSAGPGGGTGGGGVLTGVGARRRYGRVLVFLTNPSLTTNSFVTTSNRQEQRPQEAFRPHVINESSFQRPNGVQTAPLVSLLFGCTDEIVDGFAYVNDLVKSITGDALWFQMPVEAVRADEGAEPVVFDQQYAADYTWAQVRLASVDYLTTEELPPPPLDPQ